MAFGRRPSRLSEDEKSHDVIRARKSMMDALALRDHSEKELRNKLNEKYASTVVDQIIVEAKLSRFLPNSLEQEEALSEKFANVLHRRRKGIHWINQKLKETGLPEIRENEEQEFSKAIELVQKLKDTRRTVKDPRARIMRSLQSKGFGSSVIARVMNSMREEMPTEIHSEEEL